MKLIKPPKLNKGDIVAVIAPSYPVLPFKEMYLRGIQNLRSLGFEVKEGKTVNLQYHEYMAGTDIERAEDINNMFADEEVKAIICAIGGQVAIRTLHYLDFDLIRRNPKIFSGMSDITTYHTAFLAKAGLSGLHQTDVIFGFGADLKSDATIYEIGLFMKATTNPEPLGKLPAFTKWEVWKKGKGEGRLFGGNIPSLQTLLATPYFPKLDEGTILFLECTAKPLDKIDQDLVQFREAGMFDNAKGMLIGKIRGGEGNAVKDMTTEVRNVVIDVTSTFDFPIIGNMDFGHYTPNIPLPTWLKASVDAYDCPRVSINESYVK